MFDNGVNIIAYPANFTTVVNPLAVITTVGPSLGGRQIVYGTPNCGTPFVANTGVTECFTFTVTLDAYPSTWEISGWQAADSQQT